jgi:hypothetical protein
MTSIVLNGTIPKLVYGTNTFTNAILNVDTKDQALPYDLKSMIYKIRNFSYHTALLELYKTMFLITIYC